MQVGQKHLEQAGGSQAPTEPMLRTSDVLSGKVVCIPGLMQRLGLFEMLRNASLAGIRRSVSPDVAERIAQSGFEHTHRWVDGRDIPALNDAVYAEVRKIAATLMARLVPALFGEDEPYYFESTPNVRFHIPYDEAAGYSREYAVYARSRGEGKITPHGPHRDSWLHCPTNCMNLWTAVGPVVVGNGLSIFPEVYGEDLHCDTAGEVLPGRPLGQAQNFVLEPGDVLVFHGNHLHASELNSTAQTRHIVSFRITMGRPQFALAHNHSYLHGPMTTGPLRPLAALPAELTWSRLRHVVTEALLRLSAGYLDVRPKRPIPPAPAEADQAPAPDLVIRDDDLPLNAVRSVSSRICVAKLEDGTVRAFARRCPHRGGDLSNGTLRGSDIVCPLHNLPIDVESGASPCASLRQIETYPVTREGGLWKVQSTADAEARGSASLKAVEG